MDKAMKPSFRALCAESSAVKYPSYKTTTLDSADKPRNDVLLKVGTWFASKQKALLAMTCCMLLLTSCSHIHKKDGPPNFYVDETKIPNATPRAEPLAKYGNMSSYTVRGKRYYTMKSSKHYEAVGNASWYGTLFHGQPTSSRERYDMLGMTAAHKTLPLPTYVEVTNLKNDRTVIVKVNDRGPFAAHENRLIDLSYAAAKKLGMIGHGTAHVRVRAIDPGSYDKPTSWFASNKKSKDVYLQVGAFRSRSNAQKLKNQLGNLLSVPINISNPSFDSSLYHVQVGPIRDVATVNKISNRLKTLGIKSNKRFGA
jgi:rare lipoprotein A